MRRFAPRTWTLAAVGLAAGGLAACGDDIVRDEPTPPPANTAALAQPGTSEAEAAKAAEEAAARDAAVLSGEAVDEDAGKAGAPPRRLPDGVGEGGPPPG